MYLIIGKMGSDEADEVVTVASTNKSSRAYICVNGFTTNEPESLTPVQLTYPVANQLRKQWTNVILGHGA